MTEASYDFDQETLGLDWTFIRNPAHSFWSLTEKPGSLRLKGTAINFTTNDSPSFIGRRQAAFNLTASAKVNFIPKVENEEAGLVVRADDKNHYDLLITERNGLSKYSSFEHTVILPFSYQSHNRVFLAI